MSQNLTNEFESKQSRLVELCRMLREAMSDASDPFDREIQDCLLKSAHIIESANDANEKREAARRIRALFHKEGIGDMCPKGFDSLQWEKLIDELFDLSTIYQEAKYSSSE